jgi:hypothetical protein
MWPAEAATAAGAVSGAGVKLGRIAPPASLVSCVSKRNIRKDFSLGKTKRIDCCRNKLQIK